MLSKIQTVVGNSGNEFTLCSWCAVGSGGIIKCCSCLASSELTSQLFNNAASCFTSSETALTSSLDAQAVS